MPCRFPTDADRACALREPARPWAFWGAWKTSRSWLFDPRALFLSGALTTLFRFKTGVIPVILVCGAAGLGRELLEPALTLKISASFAALWHTLAFAAGGVSA